MGPHWDLDPWRAVTGDLQERQVALVALAEACMVAYRIGHAVVASSLVAVHRVVSRARGVIRRLYGNRGTAVNADHPAPPAR